MKDFFVAYNVKSTYLCFVSFITQTPLTYLVEPMKMNIFFFDVQVPSPKIDEVGYKSFFLIGRSHWEPTLVVI